MRLTREMLRESKIRNDLLVAHTAEEAEEDVVKSYDRHADAYVTKPVDLDEIAKIVNSIDAFWLQVVRLPEGSREEGPGAYGGAEEEGT